MFKIMKFQIDALLLDQIKIFRCEVVDHVQMSFPVRCASLGRGAVDDLVSNAIDMAARYEIIEKRDVCRLVDVVFVLGPDCDMNSDLPWVYRILCKRIHAHARVDELCDATIGYLRMSRANEVV